MQRFDRHEYQDAQAFNQPFGDWDVSAVTTMYLMFGNAAKDEGGTTRHGGGGDVFRMSHAGH